MKKTILALAVAALPMAAVADATVYGKANVAFQSTDEGGESTTELVSHNSRIGFKGSEKISDTLKAIYKMEFAVEIDDGKSKDGNTFEQRNIYVGLQGTAGTIIAGKIDTPMKKAQKKIDLFGDIDGDIKSIITNSDKRMSNSLQYTTPNSLGPVRASVSYIAGEDEVDDGTSLSVAYDQDGIYLAAAYDQDVIKESVDVLRLVGQFKIGAVQLGALYEDQDADFATTGKLDGDGWVVSAMFNASEKVALKAQYGESDMVKVGGETYSLGADYKLSKKTNLYGFYTNESADSMSDDNDYFGIGMIMKF